MQDFSFSELRFQKDVSFSTPLTCRLYNLSESVSCWLLLFMLYYLYFLFFHSQRSNTCNTPEWSRWWLPDSDREITEYIKDKRTTCMAWTLSVTCFYHVKGARHEKQNDSLSLRTQVCKQLYTLRLEGREKFIITWVFCFPVAQLPVLPIAHYTVWP